MSDQQPLLGNNRKASLNNDDSTDNNKQNSTGTYDKSVSIVDVDTSKTINPYIPDFLIGVNVSVA